ncbi:hypothetical protein [Paracoccus benzoatiresistens]|uniref:Uncharacterized protein n=1 Tax=Paracoccus benzoatiresistens TaxID=2997341 RepID=A0ABT4J914_9RHOB|nr:hypothetical protein [Paracoccus sp. EF6]MCZ0963087.1 hypothetical protein [Paracoccus sp. EF6]
MGEGEAPTTGLGGLVMDRRQGVERPGAAGEDTAPAGDAAGTAALVL